MTVEQIVDFEMSM